MEGLYGGAIRGLHEGLYRGGYMRGAIWAICL